MKNLCSKTKLSALAVLIGFIVCPWVVMAMEAEDAPEEIILDRLQSLYEPVVFDHLFHVDMAPCAACHHHTTGGEAATENCSRCHRGGEEAEAVACADCHPVSRFHSSYLKSLQDPMRYHIDKPGLKGAYHLGCRGCHRQADGPVGCRDCHAINEAGRHLYRSASKPVVQAGQRPHHQK